MNKMGLVKRCSCVFCILKGFHCRWTTLTDFVSLSSACSESQIVGWRDSLLPIFCNHLGLDTSWCYSQHRVNIFIVTVHNSRLIYPNLQLLHQGNRSRKEKKKSVFTKRPRIKLVVEKLDFQAIKYLLQTMEHLNKMKLMLSF